MNETTERWPALSTSACRDTRATLHLMTQIAGKIRLALTPWQNHSWHVPLYVTARGLTTSPIPYRGRSFQIDFDFIDHLLWVRASNGEYRQIMLRPVTIAEFYSDVMIALRELGIAVKINTMPNEISEVVRFENDTVHKSYDPNYAHRFWRVLAATNEVLARFRTGFIGKASPVHFFWGSFDLAVTRFSGRRAPLHPGGVPHLPDDVAREAYSHEVSSAGFWPGGGVYDEAAFYSYAYPAPEGFADTRVEPKAALWSKELGEFLLPYEVMRSEHNPDAALLAFLQSTYAAAADLAKWDRANLECALGEPRECRPV
jgi:uncharacterized protein DUF5996